jgi:predicted  nucleic acid-binding Zn-ribbon protein
LAETIFMKQILETLFQLQELDDPSKHQAPPETLAALRKRLPQPVLAHYDRCRARRRKSVVVMDGNGVCGGCHMRASRGLLVALQRGDEIQVCENCGAYLLWEAASLNTSAPQRA